MQVTSECLLQSIQNNILLDTGHMTNSLSKAEVHHEFGFAHGEIPRSMLYIGNNEFVVSGSEKPDLIFVQPEEQIEVCQSLDVEKK